jgi:hypothetical protein
MMNLTLAEMTAKSSSDSDALLQKCLALIENMLDLQPEVVSNKLMHADNVIDFMVLMQERHGL